MFNIIQTPV